ncbi:hypothetical protein EVAR_100095_1 [Eumeta japonica]|uniref:Gustatory receptor n=1 Tax=Eumeta variegata TaxID=151549 RepID=A0A4C1YVY0_EUMVA|nr:hypothetical protein EVAR_100095_1 [Eumeta japonica]
MFKQENASFHLKTRRPLWRGEGGAGAAHVHPIPSVKSSCSDNSPSFFVSTRVGILQDVNFSMIVTASWFAVQLIIRVVIIGLTCEYFNIQIKKTRQICQNFYNCEDPLVRRHTKNIVRICQIRLEKPIICGVFRADARLPLRLLALTTTYTVVLLQFAYSQDNGGAATPTVAMIYNETIAMSYK